MLPHIPLALSILPELIRIIAGDKAGRVSRTVAVAVAEISGTEDLALAEARAKADPDIAIRLKTRLSEIALDAQRAQLEAETAQKRIEAENTANARGMTVGLVQAGSIISWSAPLFSLVSIVGFYSVLIISVKTGLRDVDPAVALLLGTVASMASQATNFWLGSSQGSYNKDATIKQIQASQERRSDNLVESMKDGKVVVPPVIVADPTKFSPGHGATGPDNFDKCVEIILAQEGGFVNNPADPGGATNMGITIRTLSDWRGSPASIEDVQNLTKKEAAEIYRSNYWNLMRCASLPCGLDLSVFDMGVNAGPRTSVKILQKIVGVTEDGSVGPITLAALRALKVRDIIRKFGEARGDYYRSLKGFETFGRGWMIRTERIEHASEAMVT